jgi:hypothetical protein
MPGCLVIVFAAMDDNPLLPIKAKVYAMAWQPQWGTFAPLCLKAAEAAVTLMMRWQTLAPCTGHRTSRSLPGTAKKACKHAKKCFEWFHVVCGLQAKFERIVSGQHPAATP